MNMVMLNSDHGTIFEHDSGNNAEAIQDRKSLRTLAFAHMLGLQGAHLLMRHFHILPTVQNQPTKWTNSNGLIEKDTFGVLARVVNMNLFLSENVIGIN
jgi:hypothetical protein